MHSLTTHCSWVSLVDPRNLLSFINSHMLTLKNDANFHEGLPSEEGKKIKIDNLRKYVKP